MAVGKHGFSFFPDDATEIRGSLRCNLRRSDDRHQTTNATVQALFPAVGKEKVAAVHRAEWRHVNLFRADAGANQLLAISSL